MSTTEQAPLTGDGEMINQSSHEDADLAGPGVTAARRVPRRVLRWVVPVDDQPHWIGGGQVLLVACRGSAGNEVEVWMMDTDETLAPPVYAQVFGTGQALPDEAGKPLGSTLAADGLLVWHLFEMRQP